MLRWLVVGLLGAWCTPSYAQVWVAPRRPGQSVVRNTQQKWETLDLMVDADIDGQKAGGVRLFFYASEEETAKRAAAQIEGAYRDLARKYRFVPKKRFDYVLYATYEEFLRTNLFPLQEGVLGITATQGLHMAIPYFGDHQTFLHTSTHELAHEFMIQKVRAAAKATDTWRDPLDGFPLWFTEGLAEYMAMGPIDGENALRVRDLVTNPDLYTGHGLLGFWDDYPGYVLWTYQAGHARISFLEETYGEGTVDKLLELSPALVSDQGLAAKIQRFDKLVQEVTGDKPDTVAEKFDDWIKRRTFKEWLAADQTLADVEVLQQVEGAALALDTNADGTLVAYRSIAQDTGRSMLYVTDPRAPGSNHRIAADGRPGVESLHPIEPRNFDVADDRIAYMAEARGRDRLIVQHFRHEATEQKGPPPGSGGEPNGSIDLPLHPIDDPTWWKVRLHRQGKDVIRLDSVHVVAAGSVAIDPNGSGRIAFVGLQSDGDRDLFVVNPATKVIEQVTHDAYAERDVAWGKDGLVFASDASADGTMQLFRVDPDDPGPPERITTGPYDHVSPTVLPNGTIVYSGYTSSAQSQLFATYGGETVRLTDLPTGAFEPSPGQDDGLWSLVLYRGRMVPGLMKSESQRALDVDPAVGAEGPPSPPPESPVSGATFYKPLDPRNWGIDGGFAALGAGPGGVYGQLYLSFSDRLRDHALIVSAEAYGTPELTDAQVVYLDERARLAWGAGPFHSLRFRVDQTLPEAPFLFQSAERYYGALATLRYPLNRFLYVQGDASAGGVSYFLFSDTEQLLRDGTINGTGVDLEKLWEQRNPYPRFQTEGALRFGLDTTRYHPKTGPIAGTSVLLEGNAGLQPFDGEFYGSARVDAQQYVPIPLVSGGNLGLRASAATSGGGKYATGYWLSSYDTLRAYNWGDPALLGKNYWFANAELQIPLDVLVRLAVASGIEGVAGIDFGGVSNQLGDLWDKRVLDAAVGTNFILGPLVLRLHFAHAIDIGAPLPVTPNPWVTNFSISWLGG